MTVLTPEHGKLRLLAKGVRRPMSRIAGHLELFAETHLMVARGRNLDIVTQASTIDAFREVREDLVATSNAFHMGELIDAFLEDRDPHPEVYHRFRNALAMLATHTVSADLVVLHFELHVLSEAGFRPQLTSCLGCGAPIAPEINRYSPSLGGVYCPRCGPTEVTAAPIAIDVLKLLRYLQRTPDIASVTLRPRTGLIREAERLLRRQLESVLERRLRAADFLKRVAEEAAGYSA
jgi:DNA repair protein RecO (recombination protein O)